MTHPEQGAGQEPPTTPNPVAPGEAMPAPQPWAPPQPFFAPGSAAVPQQVPQQASQPPSAPVTAPLPGPQYGSSYAPTPYAGAPGYPPPGFPGVPDYAGTPYAPPPKRRTGLIVGIVVGVLVLCIAGSVGGGLLIARTLDSTSTTTADGPAGPGTASPNPEPSTEPSIGPSAGPSAAGTPQPGSSVTPGATAAGTQRYLGDLRALLLARPSGAVPWKDFADPDGKLTLAETAKLFTDPDAVSQELTSYKFERGAVMHWSKDKVFVLIFLFQFNTAANARDYVTAQRVDGVKGYDTKGEFGQIPDSILFVDDTADQDSDRSTIMISSRGDIVSYVTMWHPDAIDLPAATALAVSQHNRIP